MVTITREEIVHIANLSRLTLTEDEITQFIHDLQEILTYAARVQEISATAPELLPTHRPVNRFRLDEPKKSNAEPLLANAPERDERFFVVPVIVENE